MTLGRVGEKKLGLWGRLKRVMLTDVGALVRGLKAADLEQIEQLLIEADFGVPATMELVDPWSRACGRASSRRKTMSTRRWSTASPRCSRAPSIPSVSRFAAERAHGDPRHGGQRRGKDHDGREACANGSRARVAGSCSRQRIPGGPAPCPSCRCGQSESVWSALPEPRAVILPRWCSTPSRPPSRAAPIPSSSTRRAACTRRTT